jgi:hypothetical protein
MTTSNDNRLDTDSKLATLIRVARTLASERRAHARLLVGDLDRLERIFTESTADVEP